MNKQGQEQEHDEIKDKNKIRYSTRTRQEENKIQKE